MPIKDQWQNCYDDGWQKSISPESFAHPAKFSRGLIHRIYIHAYHMGWAERGIWVLDPFAGVGLGAVNAMTFGLNWIGIELEQKFVDMATGFDCDGKVESHEEIKHFDYVPGGWYIRLRLEAAYWGKSLKKMYRGWDEDEGFDSEQEATEAKQAVFNQDNYHEDAYTVIYEAPELESDEIVRIIDKPAHCGKTEIHETHHVLGNFELWNRQLKGWPNLGRVIIIQGDSRKLKEVILCLGKIRDAQNVAGKREKSVIPKLENGGIYANLVKKSFKIGNVLNKDIEKADLVISSPPFQASLESKDVKFQKVARPGRTNQCSDYGHTPGNLANMREGDVDLVVSSPTYAVDVMRERGKAAEDLAKRVKVGKSNTTMQHDYGQSPGQLGSMKEGSIDAVISRHLDMQGNCGIMLHRKENELCHNAKFAEPMLSEEADGANPVLTNMSAKSSKGRKNRKTTANMLQQPNMDYLHQNIGDQLINGGMGGVVIGEDTHGEAKDVRRSNGTDINAADAELQPIFKSTIKKMKGKRMKYGTTPLKISKLSADVAISQDIGKQSIKPLAQSAVKSMLPEAPLLVAQKSVQKNLSEEHGESLMQKNKDLTSVLSVGIDSRDIMDDGNIAEINVSRQPVHHCKENTESTFWEASKIIVSQCYDLLKPNGHAIWVTKDYVKAKKRIPFSDRWLALCESVGFKLVCRHQAMLVKPEGEQDTIRGPQYLKTERKSFFRRNHETKVKAAKFWPTLTKELQDEFMNLAIKLAMREKIEDPTFRQSDLSPKKILQKAQVLAFKSECLDDRPYQEDMMIDHEDILCLVK